MSRYHVRTWGSTLVPTVLALGLVAVLATDAVGQAPAVPAQAPVAGQGDFVPVKNLPQQGRQEALPAAPLVMGAYAFVWAALLAYVWTIWRRLQKVEREMQLLAERIAERPSPRR